MSFGLGSNVSTCETPPLMCKKITRLALGGKCGGLGASGFASLETGPSAARRSDKIAGKTSEAPRSDRRLSRRVQPQLEWLAIGSPQLLSINLLLSRAALKELVQ